MEIIKMAKDRKCGEAVHYNGEKHYIIDIKKPSPTEKLSGVSTRYQLSKSKPDSYWVDHDDVQDYSEDEE
jgi:hypothetical protein